jgi:hypothetical protein
VDGEAAVEHLEGVRTLTEDRLVRGRIALELAPALIYTGRAGARPAVAHSQHEHAKLLQAQGEPQQARQQLGQALAAYRDLEMESWVRHAQALDQVLGSQKQTSRAIRGKRPEIPDNGSRPV